MINTFGRPEIVHSDSRVRVDDIRELDALDAELLVAGYFHQLKETRKAISPYRLEERLGQLEGTEIIMRLHGFDDCVDSGIWPETLGQPLVLSEEQVRWLLVLCVREFDEYDCTRSPRSAGRFASLYLGLLTLGQHHALNDITEPAESAYWLTRN